MSGWGTWAFAYPDRSGDAQQLWSEPSWVIRSIMVAAGSPKEQFSVLVQTTVPGTRYDSPTKTPGDATSAKSGPLDANAIVGFLTKEQKNVEKNGRVEQM